MADDDNKLAPTDPPSTQGGGGTADSADETSDPNTDAALATDPPSNDGGNK
jgi:hypothetical protein